jgi:hypothetical protein
VYLRDPNGLIWSEAFLRHLYNDIQQDLQNKTKCLEDVTTQRVPQLYHFAYQFDWEYAYLPTTLSQFYQCLTVHDTASICHRWEAQQYTGIAGDISDYGAHVTQPWEMYMSLTCGEESKMRFPQNFNSVKFIAYDEEPIGTTSRKLVQANDSSYLITQGRPIAYYPCDETDNSYVLYPRPSAGFENDISGSGLAFYASGDTESDETGIIAVRDDSTPSSSEGASVDIVNTENSVFMIYDVSPNDMVALGDEPEFPVFLRKYIRYGVLSRAYGANTDGKIQSLSDYWGVRYDLGCEFVKRYVRNRRKDRDYRLVTQGIRPSRYRRHPRLPAGYPAINP